MDCSFREYIVRSYLANEAALGRGLVSAQETSEGVFVAEGQGLPTRVLLGIPVRDDQDLPVGVAMRCIATLR
jgi:hypothetical protein